MTDQEPSAHERFAQLRKDAQQIQKEVQDAAIVGATLASNHIHLPVDKLEQQIDYGRLCAAVISVGSADILERMLKLLDAGKLDDAEIAARRISQLEARHRSLMAENEQLRSGNENGEATPPDSDANADEFTDPAEDDHVTGHPVRGTEQPRRSKRLVRRKAKDRRRQGDAS